MVRRNWNGTSGRMGVEAEKREGNSYYCTRKKGTVESRSNGPVSNGNPHIMEVNLSSLEKYFFILYIGNNRNPPITDKNGWSLEIRWSGR